MSSDRAEVSDNALRAVMDGYDAHDRMTQDRRRRGDYKPKLATVYKWVTEDTIKMAINALETSRRVLAWLKEEQKNLQNEEKIAARFGPEVCAYLVTPRQTRLAELAILIGELTIQIAEIERKQTSVLLITKSSPDTHKREHDGYREGHSDEQNGDGQDKPPEWGTP